MSQGHFFRPPEPLPPPAPKLTPGFCPCAAPLHWAAPVCRECYGLLSDGVRHSLNTGLPKTDEAFAELRAAGRIA